MRPCRIFPDLFPATGRLERKRQRSSFAMTMIDLNSDLVESFRPWPMATR